MSKATYATITLELSKAGIHAYCEEIDEDCLQKMTFRKSSTETMATARQQPNSSEYPNAACIDG